MPNFRQEEAGEIDALQANGGLSKATKYKRDLCIRHFNLFLWNRKTELIGLLRGNRSDLEDMITKFFALLVVGDDDQLPALNTISGYKSHLKAYFMEKTNGEFDISNKVKSLFKIEKREFSAVWIFDLF
jgi:hypothetical protein